MQLPAPFLAQMQAQLGPEIKDFLNALSEPTPTSIHFNTLKKYKWKENYDGVKWNTTGVYLPKRPSFTLDPAFHAGAYYVQEASSMLIGAAVRQLLDLSQPLRVLDLCAAPGGKTTLISSLISPDSLLVANEVIRSRYQVLDYNLSKWGISNKITTSQEVGYFKGAKSFFDLILVDAPCSGEGLFRKDPQAIAEWSPENVTRCSIRQKEILRETVSLLKPGGVLLYSTCTYNDEENSHNAAWLLENAPLELTPLEIPSDWGIAERSIGYQCYPHKVRGEGFYLVAFRKLGASATSGKIKLPSNFKHHQRLSKNKQQPLKNFIKADADLVYLESEKGQITAVPTTIYDKALQLSAHTRYFRIGTPIGIFKGKDLIPDPALALSTILHPELPKYALNREAAIQYLRKEPPSIAATPGWRLITYDQLPLGWVKVLKNRVNNYYPREWRIRQQL